MLSALLLLSGLSGPPLPPGGQPPSEARNDIARSLIGTAFAGQLGPRREAEDDSQGAEGEKKTGDICEGSDQRRFVSELHGNGGNDRITAGTGAARMYGDEDRDLVAGNNGNDEIHGGEHADTLSGGIGSDIFVYDRRTDSPSVSGGQWSPQIGDTIVDFFPADDEDRIDLRPLPRTGRNVPASYRWSGSRPGAYAVWATSQSVDTVVFIDVDGDARGDVAIRLLGSIPLSPSSFCGVAAAVQ